MSQNKEKELTLPVFLMVRRQKTTIFIDATEGTKVMELKKMLECLTRQAAEDMKMFREHPQTKLWVVMDNPKMLHDLGFTNGNCSPQSPGTIALVFRLEGNEFEPVDIVPLSVPPELPEVMKTQEASAQDLTKTE